MSEKTETRPPIVVRRPAIDLKNPTEDAPAFPGEGLPRYWWGGDPFRTHFFNALSSTFPFGEAFFVRSVRYYVEHMPERLDDPVLQDEIRAFAAQEGHHSRIHDQHVSLLVEQGYGLIERRNRFFERLMRWHNRKTPALSIAVTAAIEHLTAILARQILDHRGALIEDMHPEIKKLWTWHALEEAEHKSVAFDVMERVDVPRWLRNFAMGLSTFDLASETFQRMAYMLWKDGRLFERRTWMAGWRFLFSEGGFLRGVGADYRAWYRRGFHPRDIDDSVMIAREAPRISEAISG